jgi:hypothetical protein
MYVRHAYENVYIWKSPCAYVCVKIAPKEAVTFVLDNQR